MSRSDPAANLLLMKDSLSSLNVLGRMRTTSCNISAKELFATMKYNDIFIV